MFSMYHQVGTCLVSNTLLLAVLSGSIVSQVSAQEPIIRYTFDEGAGDALDSGVGVATDGVLGATAQRTSNTPGMASPFAVDLRAAGTKSVVNGGDSVEVDTLTTFTLTTWLLLEGLNSDQGGNGNVRLLAKQSAAPFDGISWNLNNPFGGVRSVDNFRMGLFIGGRDAFAFTQSTESLGASDWTFLAVTYDGTQEFDNTRFYVGDEELETGMLGLPLSAFAGPVNSTSGSANFGIGFTDASLENDFSAFGFQDDVRVYDRVLSQSELEEVRLANLTVALGLDCDFDGDNVCGLEDINALTAIGNLVEGVAVPPADSKFDLDDNNVVNDLDLEQFLLVSQSVELRRGDANLDGEVAFADFLLMSNSFGTDGAVWGDGDFDGNGLVDFSDFLLLSSNFGQEVAPISVPEPGSKHGFLIGILGIAAALRLLPRRCIS